MRKRLKICGNFAPQSKSVQHVAASGWGICLSPSPGALLASEHYISPSAACHARPYLIASACEDCTPRLYLFLSLYAESLH
jgi:hypothetical protein